MIHISNYKPNFNFCRINFPFPSSSTSKRQNAIFMNEGLPTDYNRVTHYSCTLTCFSRTQQCCPCAILLMLISGFPGRKRKLSQLSSAEHPELHKVRLTYANLPYADDAVACSLTSPLLEEQKRRIQIKIV